MMQRRIGLIGENRFKMKKLSTLFVSGALLLTSSFSNAYAQDLNLPDSFKNYSKALIIQDCVHNNVFENNYGLHFHFWDVNGKGTPDAIEFYPLVGINPARGITIFLDTPIIYGFDLNFDGRIEKGTETFLDEKMDGLNGNEVGFDVQNPLDQQKLSNAMKKFYDE